MHIVDKLLDNARADTELLTVNDGKGDRFSLSREVEFFFKTSDKKRAELLCDFINDNRYGDATVLPEGPDDEGMHRILVTVDMPTTQNVLCSVSGLMVFLSDYFRVEYDGWGCTLQTSEAQSS